MNSIKTFVCTFIGAIGGIIAKAVGGFSEDMITLVIFMAVDFVTGLIIAGIFKSSNKSQNGGIDSKASFRGLCKKCIMLLFVLIAHRLDLSLGTDYIRSATIIGFIANELISIIENAGIMGVPLPNVLMKAIDILKETDECEK